MPELNNTILKNSANLKAYYRLEGNLTDSSSSGYDLTNSGSTDQASGKYGRGRGFVSASSQYASVSAANLRISGSQSFAAWVYPTANSTIQGRIAAVSDSTPTNYACITTGVGAANVFSMQVSGLTPVQVTSTTVFTLNTWYHVVGVYDSSGATLRIYVNGACEASSAVTGSHTAGTGGFAIGRLGDYTATSTYFDGILDDVAVFDTALSADQVKELYEGRYVGEGWPQTGLVAGYHLSSTTDFSGNNYHLSPTLSPTYVAGKFGNCMYTGTTPNTYLSINSSLGLTATSDFTVCMWVKMRVAPTPASLNAFFSLHITSGGQRVYRPYYINTAGTYSISFESVGGTPASITKTIPTNEWHYYVFTKGASATTLYYDGNPIASGTPATAGDASTFFQIAAYSSGGNANCDYDEVQVYNVVKDARWIRQQYALGTGKFY